MKNIKITTKITILSLVLGAAIILMSAIGFTGMKLLNADAHKIETASEEIELAGRMQDHATALTTTEYHAVANPSIVQDAVSEAHQHEEEFQETLEDLRQKATPDQKSELDTIERNYVDYKKEVDHSLQLIQNSQYAISPEQRNLVAAIERSEPKLEVLKASIDRFVNHTHEKSVQINEQADQTALLAESILICLALVSVAVGIFASYYIGRKQISLPLSSVVDKLRRVAGGDLEVDVDNSGRADEIGDLNIALEKFVAASKEQIELIRQQEASAQEKILRAQKVKQLTDSFQSNIRDAMMTLASASEEMQATAVSMSSTAEETSSQTCEVSSVTTQTSNNVSTIAAATEELATTTTQVSDQMKRGANVARQASSRTGDAVIQLSGLTTAASEIDNVLKLISDIAAQTKLLALNATIEAVRAGEAGRGFNVVASEVKSLAEQTEAATANVTRQINDIQQASRSVLDAVNEINLVVEQVNDVTVSVAASADQQVSATFEISRSVQEAALGTQQVSSSVLSLNEAATTTASASTQVAATAQELSLQSQNIKSTIDDYLTAVAAA